MLSPQEIADVENRTDLVALIGQTVTLKPNGVRYVGLCPFHNERSPSFDVNPIKRIWGCHGCGTRGSGSIAWLMEIDKIGFLEAYNKLANGDLSAKFQLPENNVLPKMKAELPAIMPIPVEALKNIPESHRDHGVPAERWEYRDAGGAAIFYICRFNNSQTGKKEVLPLIYTAKGWRWLAPQSPRPLYGLDELAAKPTATVVITEGEKCKKWAQERLPRAVAVSWMGGTNGINKTDFTPLTGRKVILCHDADWNGWKAMEWLGDQLVKMGCSVLWAVNPDGADKGWDVADSGWDGKEFFAWLKTAIEFADRGENPHESPMVKTKPAKPERDKLPEQEPRHLPVLGDPVHVNDSDDFERPRSAVQDPSYPFIFLGYEKAGNGDCLFWFYSKVRQMTMTMTPRAMGKSGLLLLAPMAFWEHRYPRRGNIDADMAMNWLIQSSNDIGMFDPSVLRGRGCWYDGGRVVIHAGSHLIVDGKGHDLQLNSGYVYEHRRPLGLKAVKPMGNSEARKYLELCKQMNWETGVMGYLLAGWVVIAPLCGILSWRPHLWMIGPSGVGKSTIFEHLVSQMLGNFKLAGQGMGTTEAGIRQSLASDALPYIADEMDATTASGQEQLKKILEYFRTMSTSGGPKTIKGSGAGTAAQYDAKSCVLLSSISAPLAVRADVSRFYVLSLVRSTAPDASEAWKTKLATILTTLTNDYVERFQARTIAMAGTIMQNVKVFGAAAVQVLKDQRLGDQLGPILAGAWSLVSNNVITMADAVEWIGRHQWATDNTDTQDEVQLLESLLDQIIRYPGSNGGQRENTVGELVHAMAYPSDDSRFVRAEVADFVLRQKGMRVDGGFLYFAKGGEWFRDVLKGRPFNEKVLKNISGGEDGGDRRMSFAGTEKRWIRVPLVACRLVNVVNEVEIDDLPF